MSSPKLKTVTLGCKVNQYETEFVREGLVQIGYQDATDEPADLCVVNTCTVTNEGDAKSRQVIRRLSRDNPEARIVVMGCYATRAPEEVRQLPNVVEVVEDKRELPDLLGRFGVIDVPTGISHFGDRHRAYIKVQDGCLLRCSYCIIPHVRPELTSRPLDHILDEARRLIDNGYRELVLTGIHLGHYGVDWNLHRPKDQWTRLSTLLEQVVALPGDFRVRLSSIEATEVTRPLIDAMAHEKVCPHIHLCLQSGSDTVLRRMRRRWSVKTFLNRCEMLRDRLDQPAITTDIIVGFPGESDAEFEETKRTAVAAGFSKIHIFPFSARRGTPAAEMEGQLPKPIKAARGRELAEVEQRLRESYFQSLVGRPVQAMGERPVEDSSTGAEAPPRLKGTSCRYAPIEFPAQIDDMGRLLMVTPNRADDSGLFVDIEDHSMAR